MLFDGVGGNLYVSVTDIVSSSELHENLISVTDADLEKKGRNILIPYIFFRILIGSCSIARVVWLIVVYGCVFFCVRRVYILFP